MKKRVVSVEQTPTGSIFKYEDGSSEMIEGVFAQLNKPKVEVEIESEDSEDSDEEEMMMEMMRKSK